MVHLVVTRAIKPASMLLHFAQKALTKVQRRYLIDGREGRTRHNLTGEPSDSNCTS